MKNTSFHVACEENIRILQVGCDGSIHCFAAHVPIRVSRGEFPRQPQVGLVLKVARVAVKQGVVKGHDNWSRGHLQERWEKIMDCRWVPLYSNMDNPNSGQLKVLEIILLSLSVILSALKEFYWEFFFQLRRKYLYSWSLRMSTPQRPSHFLHGSVGQGSRRGDTFGGG